MARRLTARRPRGFRLVVLPEGANVYGIRLEEANGADHDPEPVATVGADRLSRVTPSVMEALQRSRIPRSQLNPNRKSPIRIEEAAGVRLALSLLAVEPVVKPARVEALLGGISAMSDEEAYYWYAKCMGKQAARARRALRLLLAEE